jgi:hypothetical protein
LYEKARIYGLQGQLSLAAKNFKQAIKLDPEYKEGGILIQVLKFLEQPEN